MEDIRDPPSQEGQSSPSSLEHSRGGGRVSPVHTGCSTAARRSFPGPGCLPAITPQQSLRPSLPETSTPAMVLPTSARSGRPPQAPLLLAPFLTTSCPSKPSRPGKLDHPHTAGLPRGRGASRTAACPLQPDSTCRPTSSKGPQCLMARVSPMRGRGAPEVGFRAHSHASLAQCGQRAGSSV